MKDATMHLKLKEALEAKGRAVRPISSAAIIGQGFTAETFQDRHYPYAEELYVQFGREYRKFTTVEAAVEYLTTIRD
jgi:hypothetical protein